MGDIRVLLLSRSCNGLLNVLKVVDINCVESIVSHFDVGHDEWNPFAFLCSKQAPSSRLNFTVAIQWVISFPDLLWTKPKARSGKVRKFVFLDWLLHLTPVQSPL